MRNLYGIKAQDILLLLKLMVTPIGSQKELSEQLSVSPTEVSHGLRRLKHSRLLTVEGAVNRDACIEFLVHGLKYVFPPELGVPTAGLPTSFARPGFDYIRYAKDDIYVWPHPEGTVRGVGLKPIYHTLPDACLRDEKLYTLASLVEMLRAGRAREQQIAAKELNAFTKGRS